MSFVYAEKRNDTIDIHCDTKIGLDDYAGAIFSRRQKELVEKYGIIKTILICPEISISFSGNNIFLASKLFYQLCEKKEFTTQEVISMAYNIHLTGKIDDIEFIVASSEDDMLSLCCIKEHEIHNDCSFAWIGSPMAHREFQEFRNKNNNGNASERTNMAFLETIQSCSDTSVGGFHIKAGYDPVDRIMNYKCYKSFQDSKLQLVQPGDALRFCMDAKDGGFSLEQIPISHADLMLRINQMAPVILYSKRFRMNESDMKNSQLFSLMLPMLIQEDGNGGWIRL